MSMNQSMNQDDKKQAVALAALAYLGDARVIGVGTGSTVDCFLQALGESDHQVEAAVSSSDATSRRLTEIGITLLDLSNVGSLSVYIDGADEATRQKQLIKGGGGALTREKIIAAVSHQFICMIDDSKLVERLGNFPLPVEVVPLAQCLVLEEIVSECGGRPVLRDGFTTDNGNLILDVHDLVIDQPVKLEERLNQITGVVANGLFCRRPADLLLMASADDVMVIG
jgi:ribose 5-phosphate isomerase A